MSGEIKLGVAWCKYSTVARARRVQWAGALLVCTSALVAMATVATSFNIMRFVVPCVLFWLVARLSLIIHHLQSSLLCGHLHRSYTFCHVLG